LVVGRSGFRAVAGRFIEPRLSSQEAGHQYPIQGRHDERHQRGLGPTEYLGALAARGEAFYLLSEGAGKVTNNCLTNPATCVSELEFLTNTATTKH